RDGKIKAALAYASTTHPGGGGHEAAISHYHKAIEAGVKTAQVYNNFGWSLAQRNLRDQAKDYFTLAIQADPSLQIAYHNRLLLLVRAGAQQGPDILRFASFVGLPIPVPRRDDPKLLRTEPDVKAYLADRQRVKLALREALADLDKAMTLGPV